MEDAHFSLSLLTLEQKTQPIKLNGGGRHKKIKRKYFFIAKLWNSKCNNYHQIRWLYNKNEQIIVYCINNKLLHNESVDDYK